MTSPPVVVVGAGIVGACVADQLARRTANPVVVLDRAAAPATGTTALSSLGVRHYAETDTQRRLKREGTRYYNTLLESEPVSFHRSCVVHLATDEAGVSAIERTLAAEVDGGSPSERLDGDAVREVVVLPGVNVTEVQTALHRANAGFFEDPAGLVGAVLDRARAAGASLRTGTTVTDLTVEDGTVTGVVADGTTLDASAVVLAAGPWTHALCATVGIDLPVRQRRMSVLEYAPANGLGPRLPKLRHAGTGVTIRGRPDGRIQAYHVEPAADPYAAGSVYDPDADRSVPSGARSRIQRSLETLVPGASSGRRTDEAVAYPTRTPDGNPVVGWTAYPGLLLAATHSRGIQFGPGIGRIVAAQVLEEDPTTHYEAVSIARFEGRHDHR